MRAARTWLCCCLLWPAVHVIQAQAAAGANDQSSAIEDESGDHPLLALARELEIKREPGLRGYDAPELRPSEHALKQAHPPSDADCAGSLGAPVFAGLHMDLGQAREAQGDFAGAIQSYRHALACTPRNTRVLDNLADALFDARDVPAARAVIQQALAINPRSVHLVRTAANIDFVEERWADAVSRFRYVAASEPNRERAAYGQLMYWLAQLRAGVAKPEFVNRRHTDDWPRPLLLYMQNEYSESELVHVVREGGDDDENDDSTDLRLFEALYYVGEAHWARGRPELARDYFAAMMNIRVIHYIEHGLALAEIAKLARLAPKP